MAKLKCKLCGETLPDRSVKRFMMHLLLNHQSELVDRVETHFFEILDKTPEIWEQMNESERYGCRFGLYPYWIQEKYPDITNEDLIKLSKLSEKQFGEL